jgi:hypothetical protein
MSGTYECLPRLTLAIKQTEECVFGFKTDDGAHYAVNFGQSASSKKLFDERAHVTAKGFIVIKEALSTDQWVSYDMEGIFTITEPNP